MSIGKHKSKEEQEREMFFSLQNIDTEGATAKKARQTSNLSQRTCKYTTSCKFGQFVKKNQKAVRRNIAKNNGKQVNVT